MLQNVSRCHNFAKPVARPRGPVKEVRPCMQRSLSSTKTSPRRQSNATAQRHIAECISSTSASVIGSPSPNVGVNASKFEACFGQNNFGDKILNFLHNEKMKNYT